MFPPVLLTAPNAARAMLDYRSRLLPAARDNARLNGLRGVQFPAERQHRRGSHAVLRRAAGGITEQHINLDVAFAFASTCTPPATRSSCGSRPGRCSRAWQNGSPAA